MTLYDINRIRIDGERAYNALPHDQRPADRELFIREYVLDYIRDHGKIQEEARGTDEREER